MNELLQEAVAVLALPLWGRLQSISRVNDRVIDGRHQVQTRNVVLAAFAAVIERWPTAEMSQEIIQSHSGWRIRAHGID